MEKTPDSMEIELIPPRVRSFLRSGYDDFERFWEEAALDSMDEIYWFKKRDRAFEMDYPTFKWYAG